MKKYLLPTATILCLMAGFLVGTALSNKVNAQRIVIRDGSVTLEDNKLNQLIMLMEHAYVDSIHVDSITEEVMVELVQKLDPHSSYIPKKDLELVNSELSSSFSGIGIQFSIQSDTIHIVSVVTGGPSDGLGVLPGDKIIEVDDSLFVGKKINNEKVMRTLRGEKGTRVKLGIMRDGERELLSFVITRGDIPVHSVDAHFIIPTCSGKKIGYVRVGKFGEGTYSEFLSALNHLKSDGASSYIVDLRENSGGFMHEAVMMVNEFLTKNDLIVYAEGRAYPRSESRATGDGRFQKPAVAVLIDDFSASASEIFTGAIQDNDRGIVIGRRSFGKGLVQQQLSFSDGSAIRLTVARYYIPSGRCIQKPYSLGNVDAYEQDLYNRFEHGEDFHSDSIHYRDTTRYHTKGGRVVYGGGGIMPDLFVPRDTSLYTTYFKRVANRGYTYQFAFQYTDRHRKELSRYKDWQTLESHLKRANWLEEFVTYCEQKGIEPDRKEIALSRPLMERLINSYIVRNVLGENAFFALFERDDEITKRAIEYLEQDKACSIHSQR